MAIHDLQMEGDPNRLLTLVFQIPCAPPEVRPLGAPFTPPAQELSGEFGKTT